MHRAKTFPSFDQNFIREKRFVFADAGGETSSDSASLDFANYDGNVQAYQKALDKKLQDGEIDQSQRDSLLENAKNQKIDAGSKANDQEKGAQLLKKIEAARKKERSKHLIAKNAVDALRQGYIESIDSLRDFVRTEVERIGVPFEDAKDKKLFDAMRALESEIWTTVERLIDRKQYRSVLDSIKQDKERAKRCYQKLRKIFYKKGEKFNPQLNLLNFLRHKESIPAGEKMNIDKLFEYAALMEPRWDNTNTLINVVNPQELAGLELALDSVNTLYDKWKDTVPLERFQINRRLNEYDKELSRLKNRVETHKHSQEIQEAIAQGTNAEWGTVYSRKKDDLDRLVELFKNNDDDPTRRLITTFLDGNLEDLKGWNGLIDEEDRMIAEIENMEAEKKAAQKSREEKSQADTVDRSPLNEFPEDSQHSPSVMERFLKRLHTTMTANGNIVWYSYHDIKESFKLIGEAFKKHAESVSEDKTAPLATGLTFWRPEIQRRINEQDLIGEKGRAEERKKNYKNYNYERLIAELGPPWPAKDKRRAILEILAEKGNLRLSDRRLIQTICPGHFTLRDWEEADAKADYTRMRAAFKNSLDNSFIEEIGYAEELLNKQASGVDTAAEAGKKLAGSGESVATSAELNIFNVQRNKSYKLGTEGEGELAGMLETMVGRGNAFSNGSAWIDLFIRTKGKHEALKNRNADMGLVGLMLTDSYLKGAVSREFMAGIGKKHESGFNPFSSMSDILAIKKEVEVNGVKKTMCLFEEWGWIVEDGNNRYITDLGKTQIVNFFNTRNARAAVRGDNGALTGDMKFVHLAIDSGTYQRHSRRHSNVRDAARQSIKVGDKLISYLVKKSNTDLFNNATEFSKGGTGSMVGETDETASLIKAGVEDFVDGVQMMRDNERYYNKMSGKEVRRDPVTGEFKDDQGNKVNDIAVGRYGKERLERGAKILTRMFENLFLYSEDREILNQNTQYCTSEKDQDGMAVKTGGANLRDFLQTNLKQYADTREYQEVMEAFERLASNTQTRSEIDQVRNNKITREEALAQYSQRSYSMAA